MFSLFLQALQQVLIFNAGGEEFRASAQHFSEQFSAGFIDERDLFQIHDSTRQRRPFPGLPPAPLQFLNPGAAQAPTETPALSVGCVGVRNPKHCHCLIAVWKSMPAAKCSQLIMKQLRSRPGGRLRRTFGKDQNLGIYRKQAGKSRGHGEG
jgi:hypothetical protein